MKVPEKGIILKIGNKGSIIQYIDFGVILKVLKVIFINEIR